MKHQYHYNTCVQDGMARVTNRNFQLELTEFWAVFVR